MAILPKGHPLNGIRGQLGKTIILKKYGKRTLLTNFPAQSKNDKKPTEAQRDQRSKFMYAVDYARWVIQDPKRKSYYQRRLKGRRNAFQAAIADFMENGRKLYQKLKNIKEKAASARKTR